mmetsp:Transcript_5657/g.19248  ORF Transcript_5657/g.19248 Transcript_5657/m.19248 type:complete len:381 (+) Transcript_5657:308-1450(+)
MMATRALACFIIIAGVGVDGTPRRVGRVLSPPRLPVWPVANGLVCTAMDMAGLRELAANTERALGGRVAPMTLEGEDADPFILNVHHRHRFSAWDPIRPLFNLLLPEGFPAHPHAGFETVTVTLAGGLTHRDSIGVKQRYGNGEVQWLTAGKGVLHEEMWWPDGEARAELYQIWLNLPRASKQADPMVDCFTPPRAEPFPGASVDVISGSLYDKTAPARPVSARTLICRVRLEPAAGSAPVELPLPPSYNCMLYVREGAADVGGDRVGTHDLAYLPARTSAGTSCVRLATADPASAVDVLVLAGEPLREPVAARGTWVMSTPAELQQADRDYQLGKFGVPWPHTLTDDEWRAVLGLDPQSSHEAQGRQKEVAGPTSGQPE